MKTVIALLFLVGCGPQPDVISSRGTEIFLNGLTDTGFDRESVDRVQTQFIVDMERHAYGSKEVIAAMAAAVVQVKPNSWTCLSDHSQQCDGEQYDERLYVMDPYGCYGWSTLTHETLHLLQQMNGQQPDFDHKRPEWDEVAGRAVFYQTHACDGSRND